MKSLSIMMIVTVALLAASCSKSASQPDDSSFDTLTFTVRTTGTPLASGEFPSYSISINSSKKIVKNVTTDDPCTLSAWITDSDYDSLIDLINAAHLDTYTVPECDTQQDLMLGASYVIDYASTASSNTINLRCTPEAAIQAIIDKLEELDDAHTTACEFG